jgi:hypothetical protein
MAVITLDDLAKALHATAKEKGFWDHATLPCPNAPIGATGTLVNPSIVPEKLALISSEVGEVLEGWRDDDPANMAEELADVIIRCLDLAEFLGFSMDDEVQRKAAKNEGRPYLHGRVR